MRTVCKILPCVRTLSVLTFAASVSVARAGSAGSGTVGESSQVFRVRAQTRNDVTVYVTNAGWYHLSDLVPRRYLGARRGDRVVFAVALAVKARDPLTDALPSGRTAAYRGDLRNSITTYLVGPDGRREIGAGALGRPDLRIWDGAFAPNPQTPALTLKMEYTDPRFPRTAAEGYVEDALELSDLPAIHMEGETHDVGVSLMTPHGARIVVDKVGIVNDRFSPHAPRYCVTGHWIPPEGQPDMRITFERELLPAVRAQFKNIAEDSLGHVLVDSRIHDFVRNEDALDPSDMGPGRFTLFMHPAAPDAAAVRLRLTVRQAANAFRDPQAHREFGFTLTAQDWKPYPGKASGSRDTAIVQLLGDTGATLTLEALESGGEHGWTASWRARLNLESQAPQTDRRRWINSRFEWRLPGEGGPGGPGFLEEYGRSGRRIMTHPDHTPLGPNERAWDARMEFDPSGRQAPPDRISLYTEWQEVENETFRLDFGDIPIPPVGRIIAADRTVAVGKFGKFVLSQVGRYDARHPALAHEASSVMPPSGLVAVVTYHPDPDTPQPAWNPSPLKNPWKFENWMARDSGGRGLWLGDGSLPSQILGNDASAPNMDGDAFTIVLRPPSASAGTFRLQATAVRSVTLQSVTVVFDDLNAPR